MKNINTNTLYGAIGLLVGIMVTSGFYMIKNSSKHQSQIGDYANISMTHQMPDGSVMPNVGMNMDEMMSGMMAGLEGKKGSEFDKAFLAEMIVHHQGAVEMAKMVIESSKKPELINLANNIISAQNKEILMMQNWQKTWFK